MTYKCHVVCLGTEGNTDAFCILQNIFENTQQKGHLVKIYPSNQPTLYDKEHLKKYPFNGFEQFLWEFLVA